MCNLPRDITVLKVGGERREICQCWSAEIVGGDKWIRST